MLLRIDENFAKEHLDLKNGVLCRRVVRQIELLKKAELRALKVTNIMY